MTFLTRKMHEFIGCFDKHMLLLLFKSPTIPENQKSGYGIESCNSGVNLCTLFVSYIQLFLDASSHLYGVSVLWSVGISIFCNALEKIAFNREFHVQK